MKKLLAVLGFGLLYSIIGYTATPDVTLDGTISIQVPIHPERSISPSGVRKVNTKNTSPATEEIVLMRVSLSPRAQDYLAEAITKQLNEQQPLPFISDTNADHIQLGMNGVPVLNQSAHGSCVTFATSAAIDAFLGLGDYMSQLCNLELGSYLSSINKYYLSGWDGTWADTVIDQIQKYGFITMPTQVLEGCSGYHIYPRNNADTGNPMSDIEFLQRSVRLPSSLAFEHLLEVSSAIPAKERRNFLLANTKKALLAGQRVLIGTLTYSKVGSAGKHHYNRDSFVVTPELVTGTKRRKIDSAHEMVITGFDDNAVIIGPDGTQHHGAFTLRNSWGFGAGDWGDFYMSYDYFKIFVIDVIALKKV